MGWLSSLGGALGDFVGLGDLGSALGGGLDYAQQRKDAKKADMRAFNQALYMSNTAHQREVDDLRAAGLNPVLSAMGGSGASTPALQTHGVTDQGTEASARAQIAEQKRINNSVIDKNNAEADLARAHADKVRDTWSFGDIVNPEDLREVIAGVVSNGFQMSELPNYLRGVFGIPMATSGVHSAKSVGKGDTASELKPVEMNNPLNTISSVKYDSLRESYEFYVKQRKRDDKGFLSWHDFVLEQVGRETLIGVKNYEYYNHLEER